MALGGPSTVVLGPRATITQEQSFQLVKILIHAVISSIMYHRRLATEDNFVICNFDSSSEDCSYTNLVIGSTQDAIAARYDTLHTQVTKIRMLRLGHIKSKKVKTVLEWLDGVVDALERKFLQQLTFYVHDLDKSASSDELESYVMKFCYELEGEISMCFQTGENHLGETKNNKVAVAKDYIGRLLQSLECVGQGKELAGHAKLDMDLKYNRNAPPDYCAPGFNSPVTLRWKPRCQLDIGGFDSSHHKVIVQRSSKLDSTLNKAYYQSEAMVRSSIEDQNSAGHINDERRGQARFAHLNPQDHRSYHHTINQPVSSTPDRAMYGDKQQSSPIRLVSQENMRQQGMVGAESIHGLSGQTTVPYGGIEGCGSSLPSNYVEVPAIEPARKRKGLARDPRESWGYIMSELRKISQTCPNNPPLSETEQFNRSFKSPIFNDAENPSLEQEKEKEISDCVKLSNMGRKRSIESQKRSPVSMDVTDSRCPGFVSNTDNTTIYVLGDISYSASILKDMVEKKRLSTNSTNHDEFCGKVKCECKTNEIEEVMLKCVQCHGLQHPGCYGYLPYELGPFMQAHDTSIILCYNCMPDDGWKLGVSTLEEFKGRVVRLEDLCRDRRILVTAYKKGLPKTILELSQILNRQIDDTSLALERLIQMGYLYTAHDTNKSEDINRSGSAFHDRLALSVATVQRISPILHEYFDPTTCIRHHLSLPKGCTKKWLHRDFVLRQASSGNRVSLKPGEHISHFDQLGFGHGDHCDSDQTRHHMESNIRPQRIWRHVYRDEVQDNEGFLAESLCGSDSAQSSITIESRSAKKAVLSVNDKKRAAEMTVHENIDEDGTLAFPNKKARAPKERKKDTHNSAEQDTVTES